MVAQRLQVGREFNVCWLSAQRATQSDLQNGPAHARGDFVMSDDIEAIPFLQAQIHAVTALALGIARTLPPQQREELAMHMELVLADLIAHSQLVRLSGQLDPGTYPDLLADSFQLLVRKVRDSS
ncbi:hypothetical protein GCM10025759_19300 [Lysobacter panacisoli]|uniref:Uncharacterized protein n=1 Tax=Lysobacter panacisoli TaxID=1255263 RepID=A0ABP9LG62_9GAMM